MGKPAGFAITGGKGFHVTFKNGWTISVQFGPGNYSDNYHLDFTSFYDKQPGVLRSSTAEIACWGPDGAMREFSDGEYPDTVKGRVTPEEVLALMADIAARPPSVGRADQAGLSGSPQGAADHE